MTTTTWTAPSADVLGRGATGPAAAPTGTGPSGIAPVAAPARVRQDVAERFLAPTYLPQHDGTTLGIPSPGRPQS